MHITLFLIAIIALSQAAPLVRWAGIAPEIIGTYRLLGASLILFAWQTWFNFRQPSEKVLLGVKQNFKWTVLAGIFFFLHLYSYFFAAQNTHIAKAMILFSLNPLFTAAITVLFFKEKLHPRIIIAFTAGFIALYLLLNAHSTEVQATQHPLDFQGRISAIFSAFTYSLYILTSRKARLSQGNVDFSARLFAVTGILFLCVMLFKNQNIATNFLEISWSSWVAIFGTILIPTFLGHLVFIYLLKHLDVNWMSCGKMLEPALSALTAYLFFHEKVTATTAFAFLCTTIATIFLIFSPKEKQN